MSAANCLRTLARAAGRALSDEEITAIFKRVHKAALDIKAGRAEPGEVTLSKRGATKDLAAELGPTGDLLVQAAAERAAKELIHEFNLQERRAYMQVNKLAARAADIDHLVDTGADAMDAVRYTIARNYKGRTNVVSLEQLVEGHRTNLERQVLDTWTALGDGFLGFFQNRPRMLELIRALRGEDSGNPIAQKGAEGYHSVAERARVMFNDRGGDVGHLDDWSHPQHHSSTKAANAAFWVNGVESTDPAVNQKAWVDWKMNQIERTRYVDDLGRAFNDDEMRTFLGHAWESVATDGINKLIPGKSSGLGSKANRHGEHRQIHYKDAESTIADWEKFGDRSLLEILQNHLGVMARDIAFIEHFGPNPNQTYYTLRDQALKRSVMANPRKRERFQGNMVKIDALYNYAAGRATTVHNRTVMSIADGIANLNVAGKLGGAMWASFFGDKPMMEAVSHLNNLPVMRRWYNEIAILNPLNGAERRQLQRQGLMLDSIRSGLNRFYEHIGSPEHATAFASHTGKWANAIMRVSGMQAINDLRKGSFGMTLMNAIGHEISRGVEFANLHDSDIRTLRNYGITEADWKTWQLAKLDDLGRGNVNTLTPESIARITDDELRAGNVIGQLDGPEAAENARTNAIVKLLGAVNTESEFAVVTPGWTERSQFYSGMASQRGTVFGEISRGILQFKSFPWSYFKRAMDAVANAEGPTSKATMTAFLIASNAIAGAMILQVRELLSGRDPLAMYKSDDPLATAQFWGKAFLQGGALGLYGDFLYGVNTTRYGSGPVEAIAGPTIGPALELTTVMPLTALKRRLEGKETHLAAQMISRGKGFIPGNNLWYTKAATERYVWHQVMETMSPGYMNRIRQRTMKEYRQEWWWEPGETAPRRPPNIGAAAP